MPSTGEVVHQLPMRWADLDSLNHVNNVAYVDYAGEVRGLLVDEGLIGPDRDITQMSVRYARPLLLSRHPVVVTSVIDGDTLTQQICTDGDVERTVYCTVTTTFGTAAEAVRSDITMEPLPCRIRRGDLDSAGVVSPTKSFELLQEGRVLFIASHLTGFAAGQFVVGTISADFHAPITWRRESYESRSWITRVGAGSMTITSEISDGDVLLVRGTSTLVGFDLAQQRSRAFAPDERAILEDLMSSSAP